MKQYKIVNNLFGWLAFAIAAFTYCMTVEPTASFWDCPEFITTAYKLEVGHPPGAPFFMLTANFFTQFTSDPSKVALCVNTMSALLSATCILFLFWTITHLTRKLICKDGVVTSLRQTLLIMAAGLTGALAYTWSDTFWFSAVEGEVYAYSSMLTALVFWLILKWEDNADEPHSDRWLVLIFYLTGLSIGVHLLNLLCLPAIVLVYYFKKTPEANAKGALGALAISLVLVGAVLYGVVPGIVKVGGWFELFFVNTLGLGFNSGLIAYMLVLIGVVLAAIWSTTRKDRLVITVLYTLSVVLLGIPFFAGHGTFAFLLGLVLTAVLVFLLRFRRNNEYVLRKRFLNTSLLCMLMLMIGYSSYAVIVVRSTQNTPMDQDSPEDIFTLGSYLGREQYGTKPLFYGPAYSSKPCFMTKMVADPATGQMVPATYADAQGNLYYDREVMFEEGTRVQRHEKKHDSDPDRYDQMQTQEGVIYPGAMKMFFPRIFSWQHEKNYKTWLGDITTYPVEATWNTPTGEEYASGEMPSQADNIRFFLSYQVNFMYWRYFMWNFAGRQNDVQSVGDSNHVNCISGIPFIDNYLYGDQSLLPDDLKNNKGRNVFYCLPLLLGLLGLFWQAFKGREGVKQFWVVFFLFFMTGLAIILYLNQTPSEPRERDYAYAGSFYAFAIWIGLGVVALYEGLRKFVRHEYAAVGVASVLGLIVPLQMVSQTWDDYDRSDRYACRDFGLNYLNTLPEVGMPIIFTNGDNDTFPLWYAQETEGQRTDARVCNLSYLQTDWYTDQMRRQAYKSAPLPIAWSRYEYGDNRGEGFDAYDVKPEMRKELDEIKRKTGVNTYDLKYIIDHYVRGRVANDQPGVVPTDSVVVPVNKAAVINSGMTLPYGKDSIPDYITISLKGKSRISKSRMMVYEMLARNDWQRPMYMSLTLGGPGSENYAGLDEYLVLEGLAYRITPFRHPRNSDGSFALTVDSDKMYHNLMHRYKYGNVNKPGIYLDETVRRMCSTHRSMFTILARQLLKEDKKDKALEVLRKCKEMLPPENIPYDENDIELADFWLRAGDSKEAVRIARTIGNRGAATLRWISTVSDRRMDMMHGTIAAAFDALTQAYRILGAADQKAAKQFETTLLGLQNTRAYQLVESWYAQPSEPAPAVPFNMGGLGSDGLGGTGAGFSGMN